MNRQCSSLLSYLQCMALQVLRSSPWSRLVFAGILLWSFGVAHADVAGPSSEAKVKAAFMFKFTAYVEWPARAFEKPDSPFVIGVVEADEVAAELSRLAAGRSVNNRPIVVRRLAANDAPAGNQLLFIGSAASGRLGKILGSINTQPSLTVTELDDATTFASVINFVVVDDQVRFDVSLPAAERASLKISSRLLSVAHQVVTVEP